MNDNYIILRDEDGKAYIAHADAAATQQGGRQYANWGKGAMRAGHKYLARWIENGKYMYAYTQQQLQAHLQGAKKKVQNAVEEATGVAARKRMDAAAEKYPELERNRRAQNQAYDNAKANTDRAAKNMTDSYRSRVEAENRSKNSNVFNRKQRNADVATAKAQEEQYYQTHKNAQKAELEQKRKKEQTDRAYAEGNTDYQYNKHVYDNSLVGLVDRTAAGTRQAASNAKNAANNAVTKAKTQYDRMRDEFRDRAREAIGISDRERMDKAAERRDAWNNEVEKQRKNSESTKKEFEQALDDRSKAQRDEASAKTMYDNSSLFNRSKSKREYDAAKENTKAADREYQEALNDASRAQTSYSNAQKNADKAEETYQKEKASYDRSLAGIYDKTSSKAREIAGNARDSVNEMLDTARNAAKNASDKAKGAAESVLNNNVKPAAQATKNAIDSARTVAKDASENVAAKAKSDVDQATKALQSMIDNARSPKAMIDQAKKAVVDKAKDIAGYDERNRRDAASDYAWDLASKGKLSNEALEQQRETEKQYRKTPLGMIDTARDKIGLTARKAMKDLEAERDEANISNDPSGVRKFNADSMARSAKAAYQETPLGKFESFAANPRTTVKETVQGMIDNARSATSKAVKDAWDNIPKNADGTVNPFDKDFSDAYNKWKTATAKYENSLTAKAKEQAQKAADTFDDAVKEARQKIQNGTATIQDYVNSGRETLNQLTMKSEKSNYEKTKEALTTKSKYSEYRSDDSDFAEKNYSDKNHVEDTDFYTFKRPDGRWVILEEDMKWVLPEGVTGNDPGIKNALKNFSDQVASTRSHGGTYTADQWVDDVTAAIDKAAERQSKKK